MTEEVVVPDAWFKEQVDEALTALRFAGQVGHQRLIQWTVAEIKLVIKSRDLEENYDGMYGLLVGNRLQAVIGTETAGMICEAAFELGDIDLPKPLLRFAGALTCTPFIRQFRLECVSTTYGRARTPTITFVSES